MAFAGSFSPTVRPLGSFSSWSSRFASPVTSPAPSPSLTSRSSAPPAELELFELPDAEEVGEGDDADFSLIASVVPDDRFSGPGMSLPDLQASTEPCNLNFGQSCQFAPLLQTRRTQVMEPSNAAPITTEDEIRDAVRTLDVLSEATRIACWHEVPPDTDCFASPRSVGRASTCQTAPGSPLLSLTWPSSDDGGSCVRPSPSLDPQTLDLLQATIVVQECFQVVELPDLPEPLWDMNDEETALWAHQTPVSVTETQNCGVLCSLKIDGDLAMAPSFLQETLRVVLLRLLQPLAVQSITLDEESSGWLSVWGDPRPEARSFTCHICADDPHDVELIQETLLLEAESGGARQLLPLFTEQLCDEDIPLPRHLKLRLDVRRGL